jgi:glycosyltransferase involved in cell wall biosynthesis
VSVETEVLRAIPLVAAIALAALCSVWLVQAVLILKHLIEIETLADIHVPDPPVWPTVSAIVPTRDEGPSLTSALASRLAENYPALELVVVDDRSADETPELLGQLAATDPRVQTIRIDELAPQWLGKVHALAAGVEASRGEWLLISDADIHFEPDVLRRAVAVALHRDLDYLALVPEFRSASPVVDVLWAVFIRIFSMAMSPSAVRDPRSRAAVGSGSFMLLRRSAYDTTPGFEWLRMETADDMALGMMMKRSGARCDFMNGRGAIRVSIYDSVAEFFRGVEKNAGSLAMRPFALVCAGMAVGLSIEFAPLATVAWSVASGGPGWLMWFAALCTGLQFGSTAAALRKNTGVMWPALFAPLGWVLLVAGVLRSVWLAKRRGGIVWRETFYPIADILEGQRFKM